MTKLHQVPEGCPLTESQFRVLRLLSDGLTGQQVAHELVVSGSTVRAHSHNAFKRLGVTNATQAVAMLFREGWANWEPPPPDQVEPEGRDDGRLLTPWSRAYLKEFDAYLASKEADRGARERMKLALLGMRHAAKSDGRALKPAERGQPERRTRFIAASESRAA